MASRWTDRGLLARAFGLTALVILVGVLFVSEPGRASGTAHERCKLTHSRTVAKTTAARVVRKNGRTYGCLYSTNRRVRLGTYSSDEFGKQGQRNVRLAGRYVAFEDQAACHRPSRLDHEGPVRPSAL